MTLQLAIFIICFFVMVVCCLLSAGLSHYMIATIEEKGGTFNRYFQPSPYTLINTYEELTGDVQRCRQAKRLLMILYINGALMFGLFFTLSM